MALYDNPLWTLSHIRNSFVVSDDTGNSELVISGDSFTESLKKLALREAFEPYLNLNDSDPEEKFRPGSLEIRPGLMTHGYRPRCNTEIQLEKLKRDRKNAQNVKTVSWRQAPTTSTLSEADLNEFFPRKEIFPPFRNTGNNFNDGPKSLLSLQLSSIGNVEDNPFEQFSKFAVDWEHETRRLRIFLSMCSKNDEGKFPFLDLKIKSTAKVYQVVGYTCYTYTRQVLTPKLTSNVDNYNLYLADDGVVEYDMPMLDHHESISRYGFTDLALVETRLDALSKYSVKITLPDGTFTVLQLPSRNVSLQEVLNKALARRKKFEQTNTFQFAYNLEASNNPGVSLDLNLILSGLDTTEFHVVRQNSRRHTDQSNVEEEDACDETNAVTASDAGLYREYTNLKLQLLLKSKVPVVCAISEDKVEILPHQTYGSSFQMWNARARSRTIQMKDLVLCQMSDKSSTHVIQLVHKTEQGPGFAKLGLECPDEYVAREITNKLKILTKEVNAEAQKKYEEYKERKLGRRRTIHL